MKLSRIRSVQTSGTLCKVLDALCSLLSGLQHEKVKLFAGLFLALALHVFSPTAMATTRVTGIAKGTDALQKTGDVKCIQFGDAKQVEVTLNMNLQYGDELTSLASDMVLQLKSGSGSFKYLSGTFRVVFIPTESDDCGIDLLNGNADVVSDQPTSTISGEAKLASPRTQYAVRVYSTERGLAQQWLVYEGAVSISTRGSTTELTAGKKLAVAEGVSTGTKEIERADIQNTANIYARIDAGKAMSGGNESIADIYGRFYALYQAVLIEPDSPTKRFALASEQVTRGLPSEARYHLSVAEKGFGQSNSRQLVEITAAQVASYLYVGDKPGAKSWSERGRKIDASYFDSMVGTRITSVATSSKAEQDRLFDLISKHSYTEAEVGFQRRLAADRANSRDYLGLALVERALGRAGLAAQLASTALGLNARDQQLSREESDVAGRISRPEAAR